MKLLVVANRGGFRFMDGYEFVKALGPQKLHVYGFMKMSNSGQAWATKDKSSGPKTIEA